MAVAIPIIKVVGIALSAKAVYDGIKEGNFLQAVIGAVGAYYGMGSLATPATAGGASGIAGAAEGAANVGATVGASTADQVAAGAAAKGIESGAANVAVDSLKVGADQLTREAAQGAARNAALEGAKVSSTQMTREAAQGAARDSALGAARISGDQLAKRTAVEATGGAPMSQLDKFNEGLQKGASKIMEPVQKTVGAAKDSLGITGAGKEGGGLLSRVMTMGEKNPLLAQTGLNVVGGYMTAKAEEELYDKQEKLYKEALDRRGSPVDISRASAIKWDANSRRFSQVKQ